MEILVNREKLDITLQTEESVGDVVDGLARWLYDGEFAITSLGVNDKSYAIHDRSSWESIPVGDVDRLNVEALPFNEVDHATLLAVDEYLAILDECLARQSTDAMPELAAELPYVRARVKHFLTTIDERDGVLADTRLDEGNLPDEATTARLRNEISSLRVLLGVRAREFASPSRELALALGQLAGYAEHLIEAPVQLQTGMESKALESVVTLTELLSRVVRLIPLAEAGASEGGIDLDAVKRFAEELGPILAELRDAFEIHDTVLVGDLLEYEIAPRLARTGEFMNEGATGE